MPDDDTRTRTITMSRRAPVRIRDAEWPIIAEATWPRGDSETGWIKVRRHADGRAVVYGGDTTRWADPNDLRAGELLAADDDLAGAVLRVAAELKAPRNIATATIAQLPPEDV